MSEKTATFTIEDMHCNACVNTITKTLSNNEYISNVKCDLESKEVEVTYDDEKLDVEEIISTLDIIGFSAIVKKKP